MRVGVENRIQMRDVLADRLDVKIRRGIDQHGLAAVLQHDGWSCPAVVWIVGVANCAITAKRWDAHRRPAAQHGQGRFHRPVVPVAGPGWGGRAIAFVTSTYAIRNSYKLFCKKFSSAGVRLPLVFSARRLRVSIVCRAPIISTCG